MELGVEVGEGEGVGGGYRGFVGGAAGAGPCCEGKGRDEHKGCGAGAPEREEGHRGGLRGGNWGVAGCWPQRCSGRDEE